MHYLVPYVLFFLFSGCTIAPRTEPTPPGVAEVHYRAVNWGALPGWPGEQLKASWGAWLLSCTQLRTRLDWTDICDEAARLPSTDTETIRDFFERRFDPWQVETSSGVDTGLITGYYDVLLTGSKQFEPGRVPIYGVPDDLLTLEFGESYPELSRRRLRGRLKGRTVVPYWDRRDIDSGKAALESKVLAWADDPLDLLFLHVQGSGRLLLDDGTTLRLGYADQNGHPYRAIGKWLVKQGELPVEKVTMQSIREWARANPDRLDDLIESDPSYVFFSVLPAESSAALGSLNVPLSEGVSIAVDTKFIPLGSPVFLSTTRPDNSLEMHRLVHAQDTGGAIRGPVRADFYWGGGPEAADLAGKMKQRGQLWLLWPKALTPSSAK